MESLNFDDFDFNFSAELNTEDKSVNVNTELLEPKEKVEELTKITDDKVEEMQEQEKSVQNSSNDVQLIIQKIDNIKNEMNQIIFEREEVINDMILALITGQSVLMLGEPGTGKSHLTYELCSRIDNAKYFQWLLNRTSDPSEILGPFSIKEMENDKFIRVTDGKLPEAQVAFIDEIYKANEPILNTLLPIINEKIFYNDGKPIDIPLISLFAASNELPEEGEGLEALHDRLLFRVYVNYISDTSNKIKLFETYVNNRNNGINNVNNQIKTTISIDEIKTLQEEACKVTITKKVINAFIKLIKALEKNNIIISDRRQNECLKILQASALLNGRKQIATDDFTALTDVLWNDKENIQFVREQINKAANPYEEKLREYTAKFNEVKNDITNTQDVNEKTRKSIEAKGSFETIIRKLNTAINDAPKGNKSIKDLTELRDSIIAYNQQLMKESLGIDLGLVEN